MSCTLYLMTYVYAVHIPDRWFITYSSNSVCKKAIIFESNNLNILCKSIIFFLRLLMYYYEAIGLC